MGVGTLLGTILALFILILSPVSYSLLSKFKLKKLGITVSFVLASIVIIPSFMLFFESELYFKSDARSDLNEVEIALSDNFRIIGNEVGSAGNDIYQFTELEISESDKIKILSAIKKSKDFRMANVERSLADKMQRIESKKIISNYSLNNKYVRESYKKEKGYVPIRVAINLTEESNIIKLTKIH